MRNHKNMSEIPKTCLPQLMKFGLECIQKIPEGSKCGSVFLFFAAQHGTGQSGTENIRSGPGRNITDIFIQPLSLFCDTHNETDLEKLNERTRCETKPWTLLTCDVLQSSRNMFQDQQCPLPTTVTMLQPTWNQNSKAGTKMEPT